jgi:hypothetical protein
MKNIERKVLLMTILAGLATFLLLGARPLGRAAGDEESAGDAEAIRSTWSVQEPVETPTPLPTLVFDNEPARPGTLLAVGVLVLCGMVGLLVAGIFAAILMVRLRQRL